MFTSYPKDSEKLMLARQTGLTKNQVRLNSFFRFLYLVCIWELTVRRWTTLKLILVLLFFETSNRGIHLLDVFNSAMNALFYLNEELWLYIFTYTYIHTLVTHFVL